MAMMYLSAVGPVVTPGWRACRFDFDRRPAIKWRRFVLLCFSFPVPVILNRFLRLRFVLFLPAMVALPFWGINVAVVIGLMKTGVPVTAG